MDQVQCQLEIPKVEGLPPGELTVGRHAILNCQGGWNKTFDFTKAQVKLDESTKYLIKILKAEARSANSFDLDFTPYVAGKIDIPDMIVSDGVNEISLSRQKFEVQTVLESPKPGQPPQKPNGSIFPMHLPWPTLYFVLMIAAVILFLGALIFRLMRAARFARLITDLKTHQSAVAPDLQFYKTLRLSEKKNYPIEELEHAFRLYVLRSFEVPMFVLDHKQIIRFFKARKSQFKAARLQVDKILIEFEEIQKSRKEFSIAEKQDLVSKLYRFVEKTEAMVELHGVNR